MEPIKFEPILKEMIWGGDKICQLLNMPNDKLIGENWTLSLRDDNTSIVAEGKFKGETLKELVNACKKEMLGNLFIDCEEFPILVKVIHAKNDLSIQVHPNDYYAFEKLILPYGKTEMWYVMDAEHDSKLVAGLKENVTSEVFKEALKNGTVMDYLNFVPVKKGDVIDIPSGLIHAITSGLLIVEIQQNSDTTFRVYDYDRVDINGNKRELHVAQALDVIDFSGVLTTDVVKGITSSIEGGKVIKYVNNDYFKVEKYIVESIVIDESSKDIFNVISIVEGKGYIKFQKIKLNVSIGETVFIPAYLGKYEVHGEVSYLKTTPNVKKIE